MIQLTAQQQLLVWVPAIDFRKGLDSIIGFCRSQLKQNPFSGHGVCLRNKKGTAVKVLTYDGTGILVDAQTFFPGRS